MKITKEIFFDFLKNHNFYEAWTEGYDLDNELFDDYVPLDEFFRDQKPSIWLYSGPASMAMMMYRPDDNYPDLQSRYDEWRDKYISLYMDLDEVWMDFCHNNEDQ